MLENRTHDLVKQLFRAKNKTKTKNIFLLSVLMQLGENKGKNIYKVGGRLKVISLKCPL